MSLYSPFISKFYLLHTDRAKVNFNPASGKKNVELFKSLFRVSSLGKMKMDEKRGLQRGSELYYFKTLSLHNIEVVSLIYRC